MKVAAAWPGTANDALSGCLAPDMVLVYQLGGRRPDGRRRRSWNSPIGGMGRGSRPTAAKSLVADSHTTW